VSIVLYEITTGGLLWFAGFRLLSNLRGSPEMFHAAKKTGVIALTMSMLMWLTAFLSVGNEWFLMWQSKEWSGEVAAQHMFAIAGIILLYLVKPELEGQP
jgi:predicted small integral membrane protein